MRWCVSQKILLLLQVKYFKQINAKVYTDIHRVVDSSE